MTNDQQGQRFLYAHYPAFHNKKTKEADRVLMCSYCMQLLQLLMSRQSAVALMRNNYLVVSQYDQQGRRNKAHHTTTFTVASEKQIIHVTSGPCIRVFTHFGISKLSYSWLTFRSHKVCPVEAGPNGQKVFRVSCRVSRKRFSLKKCFYLVRG